MELEINSNHRNLWENGQKREGDNSLENTTQQITRPTYASVMTKEHIKISSNRTNKLKEISCQ